jgi:hypothetical protein
MANLKGSKTHENLKYAFAGESQANRRYLYFAKAADIEGYPEIAGLFRDTAEGETGHAHDHLDYLKKVADLLDVVEVDVGVAGLALRGLAEVAGDLGIALDVRDLREVEVAAVRLGLAREGVLEILLGLAALEIGHLETP